jgi:hypothetical protein
LEGLIDVRMAEITVYDAIPAKLTEVAVLKRHGGGGSISIEPLVSF